MSAKIGEESNQTNTGGALKRAPPDLYEMASIFFYSVIRFRSIASSSFVIPPH